MYLHNRENFDYERNNEPLVNTRATMGAKALMTVGQLIDYLEVEPKAGVTLAFGPYDPRLSLELESPLDSDASEETEGYEVLETATGILMDGEYVSYIMPEAFEDIHSIKVSNVRKTYRVFDEPVTRNASAILAELQDSAVPLEQEIQFEKTRMNTGRIEGSQVFVDTELNQNAEKVACRNYRTRLFNGERCYIHKNVVLWSPDGD